MISAQLAGMEQNGLELSEQDSIRRDISKVVSLYQTITSNPKYKERKQLEEALTQGEILYQM